MGSTHADTRPRLLEGSKGQGTSGRQTVAFAGIYPTRLQCQEAATLYRIFTIFLHAGGGVGPAFLSLVFKPTR